MSAVCERCRRERPDSDLFWHPVDEAVYCGDVFRCEARYYLQGEREAEGAPYRRLTRLVDEGPEPT